MIKMDISIIKINHSKTDLNKEWIEIKNKSLIRLNLIGWSIWCKKKSSNEFIKIYTSPDFNIEANKTVKIHTGTGIIGNEDLYIGEKKFIWNNIGDSVVIYSPDGKVKSKKVIR